MTEKPEPGDAPLDKKLLAHLGRQLRPLVNQTAVEPTPNRFVALLERLDARRSPLSGGGEARTQEAL